jgi:hypothetical protein
MISKLIFGLAVALSWAGTAFAEAPVFSVQGIHHRFSSDEVTVTVRGQVVQFKVKDANDAEKALKSLLTEVQAKSFQHALLQEGSRVGAGLTPVAVTWIEVPDPGQAFQGLTHAMQLVDKARTRPVSSALSKKMLNSLEEAHVEAKMGKGPAHSGESVEISRELKGLDGELTTPPKRKPAKATGAH